MDCFDSPFEEEALQLPNQRVDERLAPEPASEQHLVQSVKRGVSDSGVEPRSKRQRERGEISRVNPVRSERRVCRQRSVQPLAFSSASPSSTTTRPQDPERRFSELRNMNQLTELSPQTQRELASPLHEHITPEQSTNSMSTSISSVNPNSTPSSSARSDDDLPWACTECDMRFRTPGQQREHENRKHTRRFKCPVCKQGFNLRADLSRHESTVHKTDDKGLVDYQSTAGLRCPNVGCKGADRVWDRKDNLMRHVGRCRKAIERSDRQYL